MALRPRDFKSRASASSATPAERIMLMADTLLISSNSREFLNRHFNFPIGLFARNIYISEILFYFL